MLDVKLRYGKGHITLKIPEQNLAEVVQPRKQDASKDISGVVRRALETPIGLTLTEAITNHRVCVLIEDGTRAEPHEVLIEELARHLGAAKELTFIITTGSHKVDSPRNRQITKAIQSSCQRHNLHHYQIRVHDALNSPCTTVGTTSRGTVVNVNNFALDHDAFVIAADMKNHYFAGYSNAIKNFLPGICDYTTIETNHSLALEPNSTFGRHPLHPNPLRRTNPCAEDMLEATHIILGERPAFLLATITSEPYILWAASGNLAQVTAEGIERIDKAASFYVTPTDHIIVSPGGLPQDESLYNAQRGLELVKHAVRDKGEILFLAECPKGAAPTPKARKFFYDYLTKPLPSILPSIREKYVLYSHKAGKFAELIQRVRKIWICSTLSAQQVEAVHLSPTSTPQKIVDDWIRTNPDAQILAFDEANKIAVYRAGDN
ncbi:MAG: lactate racemase domain-containing protein [Promethearchaeota archaeon]